MMGDGDGVEEDKKLKTGHTWAQMGIFWDEDLREELELGWRMHELLMTWKAKKLIERRHYSLP